jgi:hypothetical protein
MTQSKIVSLLIVCCCYALAQNGYSERILSRASLVEDQRTEIPPLQERAHWFREARFGLFIHWGVYSILGKGEWVQDTGPVDFDAGPQSISVKLPDAKRTAAPVIDLFGLKLVPIQRRPIPAIPAPAHGAPLSPPQ